MKLKSLTMEYEKRKIREGFSFVVGCDEVGRGCLAGPVVAASVILDFRFKIEDLGLQEVTDSKLLSPTKRSVLDRVIREHAIGWGIGIVDERVIDEINIHQASLLAMRRSVENLFERASYESKNILEQGSGGLSSRVQPKRSQDFKIATSPVKALAPRNDKILLVLDGKFLIPDFHMQQEAVVAGDAKILSIAAASIVAKVYRDNLMQKLHVQYPRYGFDRHKGYATFHHREAIKKVGLSPIHRVSFCAQYAK